MFVPQRQARVYAWLGLCASASLVYVAILRYRWWGAAPVALIGVAMLGWWKTVAALRTDPDAIALRHLVAVIVVVGIAMVGFPPRHSLDVYSYALYGRIVSDHHENPYTHVPVEYRSDPMFPTVGLRWITTPSRYGPVFTAVSAIGTALLPAKPLPLRLWFQGIALLGGAGLCVLVWKRTRSPSALVFVALHPLMTLSVINGAHNDVFIPLAAFAGVMLVERKRFVKAGLVIAAGALVKATALFAIVAIVMWLLGQRRIRDAIITGASAVIPAVLGTLLVPGCVTAISSASDLNTNSSIWYVANLYFMRVSSFPIHGSDHSFHEVELLVKTPAMLATVLALIASVVWLSRGARPSAMVVAAVSLSAFSVFAAWVMPWYLIWGLPLLAMWNGRLRTVAAIHGAVLLAVAHLHGLPRTHPNVWTVLFLIGVPIGAVVAYGIAIAHDARSGEEIQPSIPTG